MIHKLRCKCLAHTWRRLIGKMELIRPDRERKDGCHRVLRFWFVSVRITTQPQRNKTGSLNNQSEGAQRSLWPHSTTQCRVHKMKQFVNIILTAGTKTLLVKEKWLENSVWNLQTTIWETETIPWRRQEINKTTQHLGCNCASVLMCSAVRSISVWRGRKGLRNREQNEAVKEKKKEERERERVSVLVHQNHMSESS